MKHTRLAVAICACLLLVGCAVAPERPQQLQAQKRSPSPSELTKTPHIEANPAVSSTASEATTPVPKTEVAATPPAEGTSEYGLNAPAQEWDKLVAPTPQPGTFWASDQPKALPPLAFGMLEPDFDHHRQLSVGAYELAITFPRVPTELDVYLAGDYPPGHFAELKQAMKNYQGWKSLQGWKFIPEFSLLHYSSPSPLGEKEPVATKEQAEQRAAQLLQADGLLMPDSTTPATIEGTDGTWRVVFFRRIDGIVVYTAQALSVRLNRDGQAIEILGRRRPLLARSRYPLRSPEEAWHLLKEGRWLPMYVDDLAPDLRGLSGTVDRFVVRAVELAYVETQIDEPRQVIQPYYVFRNEQGYSLYVPAVADPYVKWLEAGP